MRRYALSTPSKYWIFARTVKVAGFFLRLTQCQYHQQIVITQKLQAFSNTPCGRFFFTLSQVKILAFIAM